MRKHAQLSISYAGSPLVSEADPVAPSVQPGERAPDVRGLTRDMVAFPVRLFELFAGVNHTLLLFGPAEIEESDIREFEDLATRAVDAAHGKLDVYLISSTPVESILPVVIDREGEFAAAYGTADLSAFVIRPDGYLGHRESPAGVTGVLTHLSRTFA